MVTPTKEPTPATPAALHAYYAKVAEVNPGFPIVLQDHPASTQVSYLAGNRLAVNPFLYITLPHHVNEGYCTTGGVN